MSTTTETTAGGSPVRADPLLTQSQLADYLNVSERKARTLIASRQLTVVRMGRDVRVPQSAADAYVHACTMPATRSAVRDRWGRDVWTN